MRAVTRLCADSLRERPASSVRRIAAVRSASACDHTVRHTPWYVSMLLALGFMSGAARGAAPCACGVRIDGPRYVDEGRARAKGSSVYGYGKETMDECGSVVVVSTDARRMSLDAEGASGVEGAGRVNVNVCTVDAGCSVEATISTSRGKDSCGRGRQVSGSRMGRASGVYVP